MQKNNTVINLNFLLIIALSSLMFVNFVLPISSSFYISVGLLFLFIGVSLIIILEQNKCLFFLQKIVLKKGGLFSLYIAFLIYTIISFVISMIIIKAKFFNFIIPFVGGLIFQIGLALLFGAYCAYYKFSSKKIMQIINILLFTIFFIGIIDFISAFFYITPIMDLIQLFSNEQLCVFGTITPKVYIAGIPRVQSVFIEPSVLGSFATVMLPFIYKIGNSPYKYYKNFILNFVLKKTLILLAWLNLLLTQSPIFLVFAILLTLLYYFKLIIKSIKKHFKTIILLLIVLFTFLYIFLMSIEVNITETYLNRILVVIDALGNFDKLVQTEGSLATRLNYYINELCIWSQYPVIGVGLGGMKNYVEKQMAYHSPVPLTMEILMKMHFSPKFTIITGFFYKYITETGLIGIGLLYAYFINIIKNLKNLSRFLPNGLDKDLLEASMCFIVFFMFLGFYNIGYMDLYIWCLIGLGIGSFYKIKKRFVKNEQ